MTRAERDAATVMGEQFRAFHLNVTRDASLFEDMTVTALSATKPVHFDVAMGRRTRVRLSMSLPEEGHGKGILACHRLMPAGEGPPLLVASATVSPDTGELDLCDHRRHPLLLGLPPTVRHVLTPWLIAAKGLA